MVAVGVFLSSSGLQNWLTSKSLSANFVSPPTWMWLNSISEGVVNLPDTGRLEYFSVLISTGVFSLLTLVIGSVWISHRRGCEFLEAITEWGLRGWIWICAIDAWEWIWIISNSAGLTTLTNLLDVTPQFWLAGCLAGWLATLFSLAHRHSSQHVDNTSNANPPKSKLVPLCVICSVYVAIYTTMNWRLYFNLLLPHGDSAMYEEHLWNLLHGKGFRSYLDQGLFFGEHIQFVHLILIPLYVIWPSHLLLELCESTAIALGVFPVYWMTRRNLQRRLQLTHAIEADSTSVFGVSQRRIETISLAAAAAYLLYAPTQFLDIEIDLKTFRPEAFGIPLLLMTLDQLERRHLWGTIIGLLLTLTVKEDYSIVFGPLGVWIALIHDRATGIASSTNNSTSRATRWRLFGLGCLLSLFSVAYLWIATRVVMPWFRSGVEVHYARYFAKFGESPEQIVTTMVTNPGLVFSEFVTLSSTLYALLLLAPLAFFPLFSPSRLAVGIPLFGILCLNELAKDPRHQFHAPLVAIAFWALAGGIPRVIHGAEWLVARRRSFAESHHHSSRRHEAASFCSHLIWTSSLCTGFFLSLSPVGMPFWDAGSTWYWKRLYGPNERGANFAKILPQIPIASRVASTDFVHPRFTHFERSYDYSGYQRRVAGEERIPADTDFIVIDTNHRYSEIRRPDEIPEYRDHPDRWELLPDVTQGMFIVLKRKTDQ